MKRRVNCIICVTLVLVCFTLIGCEKQDKPLTEDEDSSTANNYIVYDGEIANYLDYNYLDRTMYIAGLKVLEEFGTSNEGSVSISTNENVLTFHMTKATGTVTGTVDGPSVYFKMDLSKDEIIDKKFELAPNYAELGMVEFLEHSEEKIELTNERMVEIGIYFKELIVTIEQID